VHAPPAPNSRAQKLPLLRLPLPPLRRSSSPALRSPPNPTRAAAARRSVSLLYRTLGLRWFPAHPSPPPPQAANANANASSASASATAAPAASVTGALGYSGGWSAEQMFATNQQRFGVSAEQPTEEFQITPEVELKLLQFFTPKQVTQLKSKHGSAKVVPPPINLHAASVSRAAPPTPSSAPVRLESAFAAAAQPPAQQQFNIPKPPSIWGTAPQAQAQTQAPAPRAQTQAAAPTDPRPAAIASALMHVPVNSAAAAAPTASHSAHSAHSAPSGSVSIYDAIIRPMLSQPVTPVTPATSSALTSAQAPAAISSPPYFKPLVPTHIHANLPALPAPLPPAAAAVTGAPSSALLQFKFDIDADALFAAAPSASAVLAPAVPAL
jgi:hypothetical protein